MLSVGMLNKGVSSYYGYIVLSSLAATLERGSFPFRGNPLGATLEASPFASLLGSVFPVMISIIPENLLLHAAGIGFPLNELSQWRGQHPRRAGLAAC